MDNAILCQSCKRFIYKTHSRHGLCEDCYRFNKTIKKQLIASEEQNKKVLEKLRLLTNANQDLLNEQSRDAVICENCETKHKQEIDKLEKELAEIKAKFAQNKAEKEKSDKLLNIIKKEAKSLQKTIEYWQELGATNSGLDAVGYQMIINAIRSQICEEFEKALDGLVYQNEDKETFINGDIYKIIEKIKNGGINNEN